MNEVEIICDECEAEYTILYPRSLGAPSTCPWCGGETHVHLENE